MASSSSSACNSQYCPRRKYDVFLSFRGEDTRKTFTGHLYEGLKNRGIFTFQDDKRLEHGDSIPEELLKAIEDSQVVLVVFSKNYATSRWCLDELVKIMECKKDGNGQTVIPLFYDVDPSHVRNQTESFAQAFDKHQLKYKDDVEGMQKVKGWRIALTEAANLKGCDIRDGIESENIQQIVNNITTKLCKSAYSLSSWQDVVGINTHLEKVKSLIEVEINDVRIMGIWGMGGVGKTTIARAIFDTLSDQFEAACFLADVKENEKKNQMHSLQNILLSELLRRKDDYVNNKYDGKCMIPNRLCSKKVLIVLDDIDHTDHLEYLVGDLGWFGNGSRVIVTTRNGHLIGKDDAIYEVTTLPDHEAMQLFNQYAFKKEVPNERFMKLSLEVLNHAKGLPLALKVWGSFLHMRDIAEWRSAIEQMKNNSNSEIIQKLKISYDGLEPRQQEMFLDIACFFRGREKDEIMQILESCALGANIGLCVLIEKSLVFISEKDTIEMHDLIQDMGKYVVNMQKDPGERSRLWLTEDCEEVMINNTGTRAVEAIWLPYCTRVYFSLEAMKNMRRLRILHVHDGFRWIHDCSNFDDSSTVYLFNSLCWFVWYNYPWESLPTKFEAKRLVHLRLRFSSLRHLWTETKHLPCLRTLDLCASKSLIRTPDFTGIPNLEYLDLMECNKLEEVHDSLGYSRKLIQINLYNCRRLKRFPSVNVESLECLNLEGCSSLEKFPEIIGRNKLGLEIKMRRSGIRELSTCNIGMLKGLVSLFVSDCSNLESLPEEIGDLENLEILNASSTLVSRPPSSTFRLNKLKFLSFSKQNLLVSLDDVVYFVFPRVNQGLRSLEILNLSYCNLIDGGLPEDIGSLFSLKELYLAGNNFEHLPQSIAQLGALRSLDLSYCERLKELPGFMGMPNLETLDLSNCMNLEESPDFTGMPNLGTLKLSNCINLEEVHHSMGFIEKLCTLKLTNCKWLTRFPALCINSLEDLDLEGCSSLENFPEILGSVKSELKSGIRYLYLSGLENLVTLPSSICKLKSLVSLNVSDCASLKSFPEAIGDLENLERLDVKHTLISQPPPSIVRLNKLKFLCFAKRFSVGFEDGVYFVFPQVDEGLHSLEHLDLTYCNIIDRGLPEDIGCLYSLERLHLDGNNFEHFPRSISQLAALRFLYLSNCPNLKEFPQVNEGLRLLEHLNLSYCNLIDGGLPEDFGCLYSLKNLYLMGNNFEHLPRSIAQLGSVRFLDLSDCKRLKELPGFMGMQNLETLKLSNCINLEEVHHSLEFCEKLSELWLIDCKRLKRFPGLCINFLKYMMTGGCSSLESYPKLIGSMEVESEIHMLDSVLRDLNSMYISFPCSLSQDIISLQHGISASDSSSQRVFTIVHDGDEIPSWLQYQGMDKSVSVDLPENWYVSDNFLGFVVCYSGSLINTAVQLIPLCDDGVSWMTWELKLSCHSTCDRKSTIQLFLVPLAGLWDASKAHGKTPNDYGHIRLYFSRKIKYGFRLLYKDEPQLEALLQMRENNDKPTEHRIVTSSRYDNSEHHDSVTNEASCSSSMKQRSHSNIRGRVASLFRNFTALSCKPRNSA